MAGPGATFRVNGFAGTRLPAKNRIRQIRFSLNMFSAEMHELGTPLVDITTQPGLDRWRTSLNGALRANGMTARYPYAPVSPSEPLRRAGFTLDGPLWRTRTSVALAIDWSSFSDAQTIMASVPGREISSIAMRATDRASLSVEVQQAIGAAHTLRAEFSRNTSLCSRV